jgi:hypothetical protein
MGLSAKWLVLPTLPPLALCVLLQVALSLCEPDSTAIAGDLLLPLILIGAVAAVWEIIAVPKSVVHLIRDRTSRSWQNLTAVALGCGYVAGAAFYLPQVVRFG